MANLFRNYIAIASMAGCLLVGCGPGDDLLDFAGDEPEIGEQEQAILTGTFGLTLYRAAHLKHVKGLLNDYWVTTAGFENLSSNSHFTLWIKKFIFLGNKWQPPKNDVKYVFLFSSGQQPIDLMASTTGQPHDYRNPFYNQYLASYYFNDLSRNSMAGHVLFKNYYAFNSSNTLVIEVFKPHYSVYHDSNEREAIVLAFYNYIASLADLSKVELVYLAGASRGGVLTTRLGREIRRNTDPSKTRILISSLDGVAKEAESSTSDGEIFTTNTAVLNPHNSSYYGYYANLDLFFSSSNNDRKNLYMYHTAGGDEVANRHTFCFGPPKANGYANGTKDVDDHLGFYTQRWVNRSHSEIVGEWKTNDTLHPATYHLNWFIEKAKPLFTPCTALGGTCQASCVSGAQWEDTQYDIKSYYKCGLQKCCMSKSCYQLGGVCQDTCGENRSPATFYPNDPSGTDSRYQCSGKKCCMPDPCPTTCSSSSCDLSYQWSLPSSNCNPGKCCVPKTCSDVGGHCASLCNIKFEQVQTGVAGCASGTSCCVPKPCSAYGGICMDNCNMGTPSLGYCSGGKVCCKPTF